MLNINEISFSYGTNKVLDNISLSVEPGEILGIIGANGSGKSTLINIICGILKPTNGSIDYLGQDISEKSVRTRAQIISVVPQNRHLPSSFTVSEIINMGRTPSTGFFVKEDSKSSRQTTMAMSLTRTKDLESKYIGELSEGQIQRVLVARSLVQNSPIMLLDEPTASLDISYQVEILDIIKSIQQQQETIILIAIHDLTLAAQYCDRIGLLNHGLIDILDSPGKVLTNENILSGYGTKVHIIEHPTSGLPVVIPISSFHTR